MKERSKGRKKENETYGEKEGIKKGKKNFSGLKIYLFWSFSLLKLSAIIILPCTVFSYLCRSFRLSLAVK